MLMRKFMMRALYIITPKIRNKQLWLVRSVQSASIPMRKMTWTSTRSSSKQAWRTFDKRLLHR